MERTPEAYTRGILAAVLEPWIDGLGKLGTAIRTDSKLRAKLEDASVEPAVRLVLLEGLVPAKPAELRNLVSALLTNNDLGILDQIYGGLGRVVAQEAGGPQLAQVTSAIALSAAEQERVCARLAQQFGSNLEFEFLVDPEVLGGVIVRVGDKLVDDTVRGRIEALRHSLGVRAA
jgi:F-type H+-transporting ATPase subunit delta